MRPTRDHSSPLLLSLAACLLLLTAAQCISPLAQIDSPLPVFARTCAPLAVHTREEVADSGLDLALDARREVKPLEVRSDAPYREVHFDDSAEVVSFVPRPIFHRRVSPPPSDCLC